MSKYKPIDATIAITHKCNSRCQMCNIWQEKNPIDLSLGAFDNLPKSLRYMNISGGEPFLRQNLPEIIKKIKEKNNKVQIIISSNGLATNMIINSMKVILKIDPSVGIRISIDGTKNTHNRIRGINGMYENTMNTIDNLRKIGVKNLGISFTIMNDNIHELKEVYRMSEKKDLQFALALVQNSDIYFQKNNNEITFIDQVKENLDYIIKEELNSWSIKRWLRAYYDYGLKVYAEKKKRLLPTGAGFDSLFIDSDGKVYPSNLINIPLGNINKDSLNDIWKSDTVKNVRKKINNGEIDESWIICTIRGKIRRHWFKVGLWILANRFKV